MSSMQRATAIGTDKVLEIWEAMNDGYPYFAVYYNRNNKYFQYNKNDIEGAREFLRLNLSIIEDAGDNAQYYLNIYPESKSNYPNSGMICSFPFRLNAVADDGIINGVPSIGSMGGLVAMIKEAHLKQLALTKELEEAKAANAPLDVWDRIGGLLETPGAAETIVPLVTPVLGAIMGILNKITGTQPAQYPANIPGIAGPGDRAHATDKDAVLDSILDRLEKHGDLVEMLGTIANFADKSPQMFQSYYNMLKSQS